MNIIVNFFIVQASKEEARNSYGTGRLSTVDLLIKIAFFVKRKEVYIHLKRSVLLCTSL